MMRLLVCLALVVAPCSLFAQEGKPSDRLVAVRISILEFHGDFQMKDGVTYSPAVFDELVASLRKQQVLERYQHFNLAAIENLPSSIQFGKEEAVVSGRTISPVRGADRGGFGSSGRGGDARGFTARISNTYQMRETGSHVQVVSRVRDDGKIVVELSVVSSRLKPVAMAEPEENDESGSATDITPPAVQTIQCNSTVLLESGVNTVIGAGGENDNEDSARAYIIVSATVK